MSSKPTNPNPDRDGRVETVIGNLCDSPTFDIWWSDLEEPHRDGLRLLLGTELNSVATRMRDRCLDAIKALRATPHGAAYNNAINDAVHKVESLTLEQGEQKQ